MQPQYPLYLANRALSPNANLTVHNKYSGELLTSVALASEKHISEAIEAAEKARAPMAALSPFDRQAILLQCTEAFWERSEELAEILCLEGGKPIRDSRVEVSRLIETFEYAAAESVRMGGEVLNLAIGPRSKNYKGMTRRYPLGPVSFISPFNYPLNLVAHKIAPALAVGCPFILKPASLTPISAILIGEVLSECNLPEGAFSILPCRRGDANLFSEDPRLKLLSFTGSPEVGWQLKNKAGKKKVVLELGGNAAVVVDKDWDIEDAVQRIVLGAFSNSGQSCISVQRILVHEKIYAEFREALVAASSSLCSGDPMQEETIIGPMISEAEAARLASWIESATQDGATILCGGGRKGALFEATLLEGVSRSAEIYRQEAFGPVALLGSFSSFEGALEEVNDSDFGLQAGVFTRDIYKAHKAWDTLEVGGVIIGDIPSWRVDHMPYGGVKDSGLGREGLRYAMEDMTESRLMVLRSGD